MKLAIRFIPLLLVALTAAAAAAAREQSPLFTDKGPVLALDPYENESGLTTGRLHGFRTLYVAEAAADALTPAKAASAELPKLGDLAIVNPTSAWVDVTVGGTLVGRLGPFREGTIHDVPMGVYELAFIMPNGRAWTDQAGTTAPEAAPVPTG